MLASTKWQMSLKYLLLQKLPPGSNISRILVTHTCSIIRTAADAHTSSHLIVWSRLYNVDYLPDFLNSSDLPFLYDSSVLCIMRVPRSSDGKPRLSEAFEAFMKLSPVPNDTLNPRSLPLSLHFSCNCALTVG